MIFESHCYFLVKSRILLIFNSIGSKTKRELVNTGVSGDCRVDRFFLILISFNIYLNILEHKYTNFF
jgi:hypothetical protein